MKKITSALMMALTLSTTGMMTAQEKAVTDLPNISLIGNFVSTQTDSDSQFDVKEIELSLQHYLYPSVKADVFLALHKHADGERVFELEEAMVTFLDAFDVFLPDMENLPNVELILGKKLLDVGKINPLHPEQWDFVDRPIAAKQFLGGDEGVAAEGFQFSTLLPTPFFSQLSVGGWTAAPHEEEEGGDSHGVEYENRLFNTRLWNSFALSDKQELEVGGSYLLGNVTGDEDDQSSLLGIDVSFTQELNETQSLKLKSEFFSASYGEEGESKEDQTGGYLTALYNFNPSYGLGVRYGTLGKHGDEGNTTNQWSLILNRQLTETSKFRVQYNTGDNVENTVYIQLIFGMGPHSHVLQ